MFNKRKSFESDAINDKRLLLIVFSYDDNAIIALIEIRTEKYQIDRRINDLREG